MASLSGDISLVVSRIPDPRIGFDLKTLARKSLYYTLLEERSVVYGFKETPMALILGRHPPPAHIRSFYNMVAKRNGPILEFNLPLWQRRG